MAAAREDNGVTVCAPARRKRPARRSGSARHVPARPAAAAVLVLLATAGCSAAQAVGGHAGTTAGQKAGVNQPAAGPSSGSPGGSRSPGPSGSGGPGAAGSGVTGEPGAGGSGTRAGCASWPAGSTRVTLLITSASSGGTYCVQTGETVDVVLSGPLSLANGSQPPQLTGDALSAGRQAQVDRMTAESYTAMRQGTSVLSVVRLPCHMLHPMQSTQGSPAAGGAAGSAPAPAEELAYRATSPAASGAAAVPVAGGAPVGTNCASQQVLRVTIVVS